MTTEIDPLTLHLITHPKITGFDADERITGLYRLRLYFANGRGASIITGPTLWLGNGTFEIAALNSNGALDYTTEIIGTDVLRGTSKEIETWVLALADLPPEEKEITE